MDAPAQSTIGAGQHILAADALREAADALGDQFGCSIRCGLASPIIRSRRRLGQAACRVW
jgi:hypothetical protein